MNGVEQFLHFHACLCEAIRLWAQLIQALDQAEQFELCWQLANIQPDAIYIDKATHE